MNLFYNDILSQIENINTLHAKKLKKNKDFFNSQNHINLDNKIQSYLYYLESKGKTLHFAIDCYLNMIADMNFETIEFVRTGKYSSSSFEEVNNRVYANPAIMEYYMHGLLLSNFLWKHHYQIFEYFVKNLPVFAHEVENYLEIGAGHGLYLSQAIEIFRKNVSFTVVDISETSISFAQNLVDNSKINFIVKSIFDYEERSSFDFITMGEVLEHVEDPLSLLLKCKELLTDNGTLFITTPTNAPTIDHIYLFSTIKEIQELIKSAGFEIFSERYFYSEDVSPEKAEKFKIAMIYGAFLRKNKNL